MLHRTICCLAALALLAGAGCASTFADPTGRLTSLENAQRRAKSSEPRIGRYVLPGLICLMLGIGFVIADAASNGSEELSIPGFIVGAIGLSLLSYAVFLQDMAKKAYELQQSDRGFERVR